MLSLRNSDTSEEGFAGAGLRLTSCLLRSTLLRVA